MAISKAKKAHTKKVANRNQRLKENKARTEKMQREFIMNLIKQEQEKGMYENSQSVDGPVLDYFDRPNFDGPVLDATTIIDNITEVEDVTDSVEDSESNQ